MAQRGTAVLSDAQLDLLREVGEERAAPEGAVLFRVGDAHYPFIAILEGEAAVLDPTGEEVIRHGPSGFLGELNLLSGQTVYLTAVVTRPMRYIAVERDVLRRLLFEDSALSETLLAAFIARREVLQTRDGLGVEVIGPRSDELTRRLVDSLRRNRFVFHWRDTDAHPGPGAGEGADGASAGHSANGTVPRELPVVRLPGGSELVRPTPGEVARALGVGLELAPAEEVDLVIVGAGPAGLGAAVYGASEGLSTLVLEATAIGGQAGTSRRIENYLGFPGGISGNELATRAVTQARKFGARSATPYRAVGLETVADRHVVHLEDGRIVSGRALVLATGADYRKLPVARIEEFEGISVFYAAGPPEARTCGASRVGVIGGGNSAAQAAIWLARGGALVTLLHRRADLAETMSDYLIHDLNRFGVEVRSRSEVAELHGEDGRLEGVTLRGGERLPLHFLFCFLGAEPCTTWIDGAVARDERGFILSGAAAGAEGLLSTSVPGIYAAGDVRSGSVKRCATAVGEGAMVVRFVHEHFTGVPA